MPSSDINRVYSPLLFVCDHAKRNDIVPILTFDQPLWWKVLLFILSESKHSPLKTVVLRLGEFHSLMSLLGRIGHSIEDSGLEYVLGQVYAPNTVKHMMCGKAYSKAIRSHFLVSSAHHTILTHRALEGDEIRG